MTDTVTVKIGGENIALPAIMNFATLKRTGPALDAWENATTGIALVSASLAFIVALLLPARPDLSQPVLEERLRVRAFDPALDYDPMTGLPYPDSPPPDADNERPGVIEAVKEVLRASGLIPRKPPEAPAAKEGSPSTETGITSSPN